ncbi:MAG: methionine gamma-lyase family protein, partial [Clostridia bacterium]|nr:methionine gamma-lyase family protein [Clostridia bacterium]
MEKVKIDTKISSLAEKAEKILAPVYEKFEENCDYNSRKVINSFIKNRLSYSDFGDINGYGYSDFGRDKLEKVFAEVLGGEDALVRPQIMSGTNAIALTLSALLHPNDVMLSVSGLPYDSLRGIIGISGNSRQSLSANGVKYEQIDLVDSDFDYEAVYNRVARGDVTLVAIQRSRGYAARKRLTVSKIEKLVKTVRSADEKTIIFVDNCYGELVEKTEPLDVGADVIAGSLMKNLGGGVASSGGYVAGKSALIEEVAERLTAPCIGKS